MQIKRKLMNQTRENNKNLILVPNLVCLAQIWAHKIFFKEFYLY